MFDIEISMVKMARIWCQSEAEVVLRSGNWGWPAAWCDGLRCFVWRKIKDSRVKRCRWEKAGKQHAYGSVGKTDVLVLLGSIWTPNHPSVEFTCSIKLVSKKSPATNEWIITKHR